jgi:RNA polymerase sigma factor (sigma-70 family)
MGNEEIVERIQKGIDTKENLLELWEQNKGLIGKAALRYSAYEDMEDLRQQGYMGLYVAAMNYNPDGGALFSTYATICIKREMQRYIEDCGGVVRVPNGLSGLVREYKRLEAYVVANYGRKPTEKEAMINLGISRDRLEQLRDAMRAKDIESLDKQVGHDGEEVELLELVAGGEDPEGETLDRVEHEELEGILWDMVGRLPQEQSHIIIERYRNNRALKELADEAGETASQTKHKELKALKALRYGRGSARLQSFLPECYNPMRGNSVKRFNATWTSSTEYVALELAR